MNHRPIQRWTSETKYVDIDTGEQITKYIANRDYIIIKNEKHVKLNELKTAGHIEHTKQCRKQPQLKLYPDH